MSQPSWSQPVLRNPYERALFVLGGLAGLGLVTALAFLGLRFLVDEAPFTILTILSASIGGFFGLLWVTIWLLGLVKIHGARTFLGSDRPLLRWAYTGGEWQALRQAEWQEEKGDWRVQWGCLAALIAAVGLLTGAMLGADEGLLEAVLWGLAGLGLGLAAGGAVGAVVAGGNYVAARRAAQQAEPGIVALAPHEVYAAGDYFRGNGRSSYIWETELLPVDSTASLLQGEGRMLRLVIHLPQRPWASGEQEWPVFVPGRLVSAVEQILPQLRSSA